VLLLKLEIAADFFLPRIKLILMIYRIFYWDYILILKVSGRYKRFFTYIFLNLLKSKKKKSYKSSKSV
ncbi:hypothetical protein, partial [Chitinophaga hostae]|uniref:hypothetical protein n=1 Tax=Chitinophaga hostae TaxID=2831022 RepID=UPI003F69A458